MENNSQMSHKQKNAIHENVFYKVMEAVNNV